MRSEQLGIVAEHESAEPVPAELEPGQGARYLACLGVAFLLVGLLGPAWRTGFPASFPDSSSYVSIAAAGPLSSDFWFGQRPPTYPLLIWIVGPSTRAVIVAQTLIAFASWAWMISTVWTLIRSRWVAAATIMVLVLVALQSRWLFWNTALLTESLSASLAVAGVAAWWRWWMAPTTFRTVTGVTVTVAWMLLRDSNAVTLVVVVVPAFVVLLVMERRRSSSRRRLLAVALTVFIVAGGYSVTAQVVSNRGETSLHNNVALRYLPDEAMSNWMEARGMPMSTALRERSGKDAWADGEAMLRSPRLVDYREWADGTGKIAVPLSFVVKADWYVTRAHRELPAYTGTDHLAYDTFGVAGKFPERPLWRFDPVGSRGSLYAWMLLAFIGVGVLWQRRRTTGWFGLFVLLPVLVDLYLVYVADAVEVGRHLVGPLLRFSVVSVIVLALATDTTIDVLTQAGADDV